MAALALLLGCSPAPDRAPTIGSQNDPTPPGTSEACQPGKERECGFTLEQNNGIRTCYHGIQRCEPDEHWGDCTDGTVETRVDPDVKSWGMVIPRRPLKPDATPQTLSEVSPVDCIDPCDPYCHHFVETSPDLGSPTSGGGGSSDFPGTSATCAHPLCDTSDATPLDETCDPCVQKVCSAQASCCTSEWNAACVDLVYSECAGTSPPLSLCDFGVFSLSGLETANRPSAGAALGSIGSITIGTDATPGMIVTLGDLHINSPNGKTITTSGGVWVAGSATAQNGAGAQYYGDWHVGGGINLNGGNTIIGDVFSGSTPTGVTIIGAQTAPAPPPVIDIPDEIPPLPATCPGGTNYSVSNGTRTLTAGNYGTVNLSNSAKLTLNGPGRYTFSAINGSSINTGGIQIGTDSSAGTYEVIVCGDLTLGNHVNIIDSSADPNDRTKVTPVLASPERLVVYVGGNVTFGTDNQFAGVLIVPEGKYTASDRTSVSGAIWAKDFKTGTDMNATQLSASACEALDLEPPVTSCPVESSGLPPGANEPCLSGADCQMNQRCTAVATEDCEHSKCLTGSALEESCDPCVAMICDAEPACCSGGWTADCVEMVGTVCDASCGSVTGCSHDMCATGQALAEGCDTESCTETVCGDPSYAYCCDASDTRGWDQDCVDRAVATCSGTPSGSTGGGICEYAVHWTNSYIGTASTSGGLVGTGESVNVRSFTCGSGSSSYGTTTLPPGTHGNVVVSGWGSTLTLQQGSYFIQSLTVTAGARLQLPASGSVVLNVCGSVIFGQQAEIRGLATGADQLRLELYTNGDLSAGPAASLAGVLMLGSSTSSAVLRGPTTHQGPIWSNGSVTMQNDWGSNPTVSNTLPELDCQSAGLGGTACPVTTEPPEVEEDGFCVSNEDGWEEPYCTGYDLALGYVCAAEVPVCNHGSEVFPGGAVTVGLWDTSAQQFAIADPDPSLGSTCSDVLPEIAPGSCSNLPCSLPGGEDTLVMLDPSGDLAECHGHRLDNWTWRDDDFVCTGSGSYAEYEYIAECPEDTSALWKNLTWVSSVPSGSSISFSAKVGNDLADVAARPFQALGTAEPEPIDTTSCLLGGPSPACPVQLTDQLGLGSVQGQVLSLRIDVDASGGVPSITDWTISYSCRFDQ